MDSLEQLRARWKASDGVDTVASERGGVITLSRLIVPKEKRGNGVGSRCLVELAAYADATTQVIACSPSTDFGATSVTRLKRFYQRFGFCQNKGRAKDFRISESMVRYPQTSTNPPK